MRCGDCLNYLPDDDNNELIGECLRLLKLVAKNHECLEVPMTINKFSERRQ